MQTYIVIFASHNKAQAMRDHLRGYGTWGKITDNAFTVVTTKTAAQIRDELYAIKEARDTVFVIRSGAVAAWTNVAADTDWLKKYL